MIRNLTKYLACFCLALACSQSIAFTPKVVIDDPFESGILPYHQIHIIGDPEKIIYDDRLIIDLPDSAEDPLQVPVLIDATKLGKVEKIVSFVDYGPIPKILSFYPKEVQAKFSFRFKVDQGTVVRAAALTNDGVWHIVGRYISASGGGCSMPALAYGQEDWSATLGQVRGRFWPNKNRLRFSIDHPMDTGLASNIPVFIIETVDIKDNDGQVLASFEFHEPVSEDPAIGVFFANNNYSQPLQIIGRDNNGNEIDVHLPVNLQENQE